MLEATRLRRVGTPKITYQDNTFRNSQVAFVDPNFFNVFTLPFIQGDAKTALLLPNQSLLRKNKLINILEKKIPLINCWNLKMLRSSIK
ncbi:MAG: hypothetical protein U5K54_14925 [Cytophagales bacterium]|nr:hypothetical protein [Cytophagales bacterium]